MADLFVVYVECIVEKDGKILMIKRPPGVQAENLMCFPGGKVDIADGLNSEDALISAVKRELLEEVGLDIKDPIRVVYSNMFEQVKDHQKVIGVTFHCVLNHTDPTVIPSPREVPEYQWVTPEQAMANPQCPAWVKSPIQRVFFA